MNSQVKLKYIPTDKRIVSIIKNRSKLGLLTDSLELINILREDIYLSRYSVYYHLKKLTDKKIIYFHILNKKIACNKPTKYYFCITKKNKNG